MQEDKHHLLDLTVIISKQPLVEPVGLLIVDAVLETNLVEWGKK